MTALTLISSALSSLITRTGYLGWVCTLDANQMPNVSPRYILEIGPDYLLWANSFTNKTHFNLNRQPKVTIGFAEYLSRTGYEVSGTVELLESGPVFDRISALALQRGFPMARKVARLRVESVRSLA